MRSALALPSDPVVTGGEALGRREQLTEQDDVADELLAREARALVQHQAAAEVDQRHHHAGAGTRSAGRPCHAAGAPAR